MCHIGDDEKTKTWIILYVVISAVLIITLFPIGYHFIQNFRSNKAKTLKNTKLGNKFFYVGLLYLIQSSITLMLFSPEIILSRCHYESYISNEILKPTIAIGYGSQLCLMEIIWFMRLYEGFKGTTLALNKCTVNLYVILNIIGAVFIFPMLLSYHFINDEIFSIIFAVAVFFYISITISFAILFIHKLIKAHQNINSDAAFIETIIKILLLTICSTVITIITIIATVISQFSFIHSDPNALHAQFAWYFGSLIDIYSNILCVILSYSDFNFLYLKLCGCTHKNCNVCWNKLIMSKNVKPKSNTEINNDKKGKVIQIKRVVSVSSNETSDI
eukprot:88060_1